VQTDSHREEQDDEGDAHPRQRGVRARLHRRPDQDENPQRHRAYQDGDRGIGTGLILNAGPADAPTTAYVLTAKHLLTTLSGEDSTKKTPNECATATFLGKLKLFYGPTGIEVAPPSGAPAAVSAVLHREQRR
jgi:hypothetical protein